MSGEMRNNDRYQVLTPDGFKNFAGISMMGVKNIKRVTLENGMFLDCTEDHKIFINNIARVPLSEVNIGNTMLTSDGDKEIISIEDTGVGTEPVYDLVEVEGGHRYYANGILSSNCKFIVFEETLINSSKLAKLEGAIPLRKNGEVRWYQEINKNATYIVCLDPSMGTGGDNAAIQVWESPSLTQIAEWQHNKTPIEGQMKVLKQVLKEIATAGATELYWSIETNNLGEAALVVLRHEGEESYPGTMLHDPRPDVGGKNRRKGFITTNKSKLEACVRLKSLIENGKLNIKSKTLIGELKNFVAKGNTYEARYGSSDDLVMSTILFVRMLQFISGWDDGASRAINQMGSDDDFEDDFSKPMPIVFC